MSAARRVRHGLAGLFGFGERIELNISSDEERPIDSSCFALTPCGTPLRWAGIC